MQLYDSHKRPVSSIAMHPTGYYLASTSYDETVKIWDLRKGELLYTLVGHDVRISLFI
jgi:centriolar protein POC1